MKLESLAKKLFIFGVGLPIAYLSGCEKESTTPQEASSNYVLLKRTPNQIISSRGRYLNTWGKFSIGEYLVGFTDDGGCCFLTIGANHAELSKTFVPNLKNPSVAKHYESGQIGYVYVRERAVLRLNSSLIELRETILDENHEKKELHWLVDDLNLKVRGEGNATYSFSRFHVLRKTGNPGKYDSRLPDSFEELYQHLGKRIEFTSRTEKGGYRFGYKAGRAYRRQIESLARVMREIHETITE